MNEYLSVSQLNNYINRLLIGDTILQDFWLKGEISGFRLYQQSGHAYFTLKDEESAVSCVIFKSRVRHLKFKPEDGMEVLIRGSIAVYARQGKYQIYAEEMQPYGIGGLFLYLEELKNRLKEQGYFDQEKKKPIPALVNRVGVVTSQDGAAFQDILDRSSFIGGSYVDTFEKDFASFCGVKNAIACASGTDALKLALMAAGVRQGDAVITVPNTFIATVEAITMVGATPIFVDIDKQTYHLSPFLLEEYLENNTRLGIGGHRIDGKTGKTIIAVLPVHLFGMMVDMKPILEIAAKYNLVVVEDCAQAHGATYTLDGTTYKAGTLGVTAGFSFYPGKNLGALGEGGAVTTNDINVANFMRMLRDHGSNQKYIHTTPDGWNSRLDALQCAFLDIKLKILTNGT